jgi:hypothetical protein
VIARDVFPIIHHLVIIDDEIWRCHCRSTHDYATAKRTTLSERVGDGLFNHLLLQQQSIPEWINRTQTVIGHRNRGKIVRLATVTRLDWKKREDWYVVKHLSLNVNGLFVTYPCWTLNRKIVQNMEKEVCHYGCYTEENYWSIKVVTIVSSISRYAASLSSFILTPSDRV